MTDGIIERTSMYACDYDHLTELGSKPVFDSAPSVKELERVATIIDDCTIYLSQPRPGAMPDIGLSFITDMWVYRFDECCTEVAGDAVSDTLFVARCFLLCAQIPRCRTMSTFNDIHELYSRLQLLGTNHTRRRFEQPISHLDVVMLEKRVASLVVYHLSESPDVLLQRLGPDPLPAIDELLAAEIEPLRNVPDIIKPTADELRIAAEKAVSDALALKTNVAKHDTVVEEKNPDEIEYDVNEGSYWHSDKTTVVRGFVRMASRVLRNYWLQKMIFDRYPIRAADKMPVYAASVKTHMREWLVAACEVESSDDSVKVYRELIYEHWMPMGSRQEMLRLMTTKYDFMQALNLLEKELGVDSATSLANMARVKLKTVAADEKNEVFDFLYLAQFCYLMKHLTATDFKKLYYIMPGELGKLYKRLDCKITWGQPRRPILVPLLHMILIHDAGEWIPCSSMEDGLAKMMTLWTTKYESRFVDRISVAAWVAQLTSERNDD